MLPSTATVSHTTDAPQPVRDLVDMTDAAAQAAMKRAVEIDALADLELQAAEQINQQLQNAAPGSAPILEAQTSAWLVRANAYTQSAMAELIRVRSIELANQGAQLKFSASHAGDAAQLRAAKSCSRESSSVFYFQQLLNMAMSRDRRHRHHPDRDEFCIRHPAHRISDRTRIRRRSAEVICRRLR